MDNMQYGISVRKGDLEISVQGDKEWVEGKFKELLSEEKLKPTNEMKHKEVSETLGEFLGEKGDPKTHTDVVAAFAYWLFKKQGLSTFNAKDILACYDTTRRPKPKNANMIINANVKTHLFAEAPDKKDGLKAWVITGTGETYVEQMKA